MEIKNDFVVDPNQEHWVGIVVTIGDQTVWIFEEPVHGYDVHFGNNPKKEKGRKWSQ